MKLELSSAPYIYSSQTTNKRLIDLCLCMVLILVVAYFYYGSGALMVSATSVAAGYITNILSTLLLFRRPQFKDISSIYTSLAIALLLPANIPLYVVVVANVITIFAVKHPFGGTFQNIFNPVACALAFATVTYSSLVLRFPMPFSDVVVNVSATDSLALGGVPNFSVDDILIGLTPTAMGTGFGILILACGFYLIIRRVIRFRQFIIYIFTLAVLSIVFPRVPGLAYMSAFYEIFAYPTLFYFVFVLTDSVTSPARAASLDIYSALSAAVIFIFRHFGVYSITEPFAILLLNSLVPMIDACVENMYTRLRRRAFAIRQKRLQEEFISSGTEE